MSVESAKEYIERMKNDEMFAKRVIGCKSAGERSKLVRSAGFDFTKDEIESLKGELTDDDLNRTIFQESRLGFDCGGLGHGW